MKKGTLMEQYLYKGPIFNPWRIELFFIFFFAAGALGVLFFNPTPVPGSLKPSDSAGSVTAQVAAMPSQGWYPLTVYFSGYASHSSDGNVIQYEWDMDSNGVADIQTSDAGGYVSYTFVKPGIYPVTLTVRDDHGRSAQHQVVINVWHPARSPVDYWEVFDDTRVRRIDIRLTQADWQKMWSDIEQKYEVPADTVIFGEPLDNVGLRVRGQFSMRTSRDKKPWRIDTDVYEDGQEFHNLRQILLLNNIGDPTLLKEKLAYELMYFAGVPASHVAFVEVWFDFSDDDQSPFFWGVYSMVERVDKKYLTARFGQESKTGNLYKASHAQRGPMNLVYYGDSITDYPTQNGQYAYGKETNIEENDYSDIIQLARVLDGVTYASQDEFASALESEINVDGFLRYMAVITVLANWDSYPNTGNNFFLFNNPVTQRFEWIPWDLTWDENPRAPVFEIDGFRMVGRAPMYDKVLQVEKYRRQYSAYIDLLLRYRFNYDAIYTRAEYLHNLIAPYVAQGDRMFYGENAMLPPEAFDNWESLANFADERSAYIYGVLKEETYMTSGR